MGSSVDDAVFISPKVQHTLDTAEDDLEQLAADCDDLGLGTAAALARRAAESIARLRERSTFEESTGGRTLK